MTVSPTVGIVGCTVGTDHADGCIVRPLFRLLTTKLFPCLNGGTAGTSTGGC